MTERGDATRDEPLDPPLLGRLLLILVLVPAAVLAVVSLVSVATGILFGNVLFVLTGLVVLGWMYVGTTGWGGRMGAVRPENALLVSADEHYAREVSAGAVGVVREPAPLLVSLTVAVVLGWVVLFVAP